MPAKKARKVSTAWTRQEASEAVSELFQLRAQLKAERAECFYWKTEAELLRNDFVAQLRESAKTKPWPDVS